MKLMFWNTVLSLQTHSLEIGRKLLIGFVSGTIASCVNIPFDVAKSRIQGPQPVPGEIKYRTCFKTIATVYKEEGWDSRSKITFITSLHITFYTHHISMFTCQVNTLLQTVLKCHKVVLFKVVLDICQH